MLRPILQRRLLPLFLFAPSLALAQRLEKLFDYTTWQGFPTYPTAIEFDRADSVLYMGFWPCVINDAFMPGLARWDGEAWEAVPNTMDSLQCTTQWVRSLASHEGSVFASGRVTSFGSLGPASSGLARYDDDGWHICGSPNNEWLKVVVVNDTLWAIGWYGSIDGEIIGPVARYIDGQWDSFGPSLLGNHVRAAAIYNGKYFIGGNLTQPPITPLQDIVYWDGVAWQQVGEGFGHQNSHVNAIAAYQGQLFVGGALFMSDGIPGQHLVVWDGVNWSGFFQDRLLCRNQVNDLQVIDGKLYMAGVFQFAGDAHYFNLLQYDGVNLCAVGKDLTAHGGLYANQVRGNSHEIYFSNEHIAYAGDTVNYMAKWVLSLGPDTCINAPLGMLERAKPDAHLFLHGNPQHAVLGFTLVAAEALANGSRAGLYALDGRLMTDMALVPTGEGRYAMDVAAVPPGLYLLNIDRPSLPRVSTKVVLE
jgi:hypothetical protein